MVALLGAMPLLCFLLLLVTVFFLFKVIDHFESTPFAAEVQTTHLSFVAANPAVEEASNNAGLFAPSGLLNVQVDGCGSIRPLGDNNTQNQCNDGYSRLEKVKLDTLLFGPGSRVEITVESGMVKIFLTERGDAKSIRVVLNKLEGKRSQWLVLPAHSTLTLRITEADKETLPGENNIPLAENSAAYFETGSESALVGEKNTLTIARLGKNIKLKDSRLQLQNLHSARIRSIAWIRSQNAITSLKTVITGHSDRIQLYSQYSDEPSNEALNSFDYYSKGRHGRFLLAIGVFITGSVTIVLSLLTFLTGFAVSANAIPEFLEKFSSREYKV